MLIAYQQVGHREKIRHGPRLRGVRPKDRDGYAKLPPEKRITRTNVPASGGKPWAQLEPLESGLFGPVRVVAVAQQPVGR